MTFYTPKYPIPLHHHILWSFQDHYTLETTLNHSTTLHPLSLQWGLSVLSLDKNKWKVFHQVRTRSSDVVFTVRIQSCYRAFQSPRAQNYLRHRRWMEVIFSPLSVCLSLCLSVNRISHKVVDGFGQNLVESLVM